MIQAVTPYLGDGFLREAQCGDLQIPSSSREGVFKLSDGLAFLELPVWPFGQMLAFAKM